MAKVYYRKNYGFHAWLGYWLELWCFVYEEERGAPARMWESFDEPLKGSDGS